MDRLSRRLVAVILVVLGLIAMHQLSSEHRVATGQPADPAAMTALHGAAGDHAPADDQGCADCAGHEMALATCLLILTLLLVAAALIRPGWRLAPPGLTRPLPRLAPPAVRFRTALSLIELSISRT
ncbi:DUF6153 family protein [Microlunatus speluncae]|uniref:DUF6153 family protein n=1 Tax=Microlunatus speluncae TaxID=2594267 RepID=UPI0012663E6F|nr:DUF6153 family protein [Microlunatus speluncae]